jgi:hypothetical protein
MLNRITKVWNTSVRPHLPQYYVSGCCFFAVRFGRLSIEFRRNLVHSDQLSTSQRQKLRLSMASIYPLCEKILSFFRRYVLNLLFILGFIFSCFPFFSYNLAAFQFVGFIFTFSATVAVIIKATSC